MDISDRCARGSFEVHFAGTPPYVADDSVVLTHDTGHKDFKGDVVGTSSLHMLSAVSSTEGSAGYVVIEQFEGTVHGREGSFVLQHFGLMDRGLPALRIEVVPDSGTGELTGIRGQFDIDISDGTHRYTFTYTLEPR